MLFTQETDRIFVKSWEYQPLDSVQKNNLGFWIGLTIFGIWAMSLVYLFNLNLSQVQPFVIFIAILCQTFLYTGLFITAHDAMHGSILPKNPQLNHIVGAIAVTCYGLFSYKDLLKKHWMHHRHPASEQDPDFHKGQYKNALSWYFQFMQEYWCWVRALQMIVLFYSIHFILHIPQINLYLFWLLPLFLSSIQLFYFGTFLPHREPQGGYKNKNRAQSSSFPIFWSLMTCYHFGYHEEHHQYPDIPWWQLPKARQSSLSRNLKML